MGPAPNGSAGPTNDWTCEAYGVEAAAVGALCFFAELGTRVCQASAECADRLAGERQRVFRRINELAAAGNETGAYLAEEFTNPEQLLGGHNTGSADDAREP